MTRSIWVTGANGFIGRHLLDLLSRQYDIRVGALGFRCATSSRADDEFAPLWEEGEIDEARLDALASAMGPPDIVYHLAGGASVGSSYADPQLDFRRTALSTAAITDWLRRRAPGARLVQISSAAIYGAGHDAPITEDARLDPFSPYGAHKLIAETLCHSAHANFGLDTWIIRPFSVYGPGLRKQLLWDCCSRLALGCAELALGGNGTERRDWLHVSDLCVLLWQIADTSPADGTTLNAGTGKATTVDEIARMLVAAWGTPALPIRFSGDCRPGDPFSLVANTDRASRLGFAARQDVGSGITDYVDWFRGQ